MPLRPKSNISGIPQGGFGNFSPSGLSSGGFGGLARLGSSPTSNPFGDSPPNQPFSSPPPFSPGFGGVPRVPFDLPPVRSPAINRNPIFNPNQRPIPGGNPLLQLLGMSGGLSPASALTPGINANPSERIFSPVGPANALRDSIVQPPQQKGGSPPFDIQRLFQILSMLGGLRG